MLPSKIGQIFGHHLGPSLIKSNTGFVILVVEKGFKLYEIKKYYFLNMLFFFFFFGIKGFNQKKNQRPRDSIRELKAKRFGVK